MRAQHDREDALRLLGAQQQLERHDDLVVLLLVLARAASRAHAAATTGTASSLSASTMISCSWTSSISREPRRILTCMSPNHLRAGLQRDEHLAGDVRAGRAAGREPSGTRGQQHADAREVVRADLDALAERRLERRRGSARPRSRARTRSRRAARSSAVRKRPSESGRPVTSMYSGIVASTRGFSARVARRAPPAGAGARARRAARPGTSRATRSKSTSVSP